MRSVRGEAVSLSLALSLPVAAFCIMPYSMTRAAKAPAAGSGFAAFVTLTPKEEALVMRMAKPSARADESEDASRRAMNLILGELPVDDPAPLLATPPPARPPRLPDVTVAPGPFLPSQAAPPLRTMPADDAKPAQPGFSRDDLLKIF